MKKLILIADDDNKNLKLLRDIFNRNGYDTLEAKSGYECINIAKNYSPDLICLDIFMPQLDGYEIIKKLKVINSTKKIPIIVISANAMPEDRMKILNTDCNLYLSKPIDINELLNEVKTLLSGNLEN